MNILGVAHFHLGQYQEAIAAVEEGNANGGPVSALGVVYLAAFPNRSLLTRLHRQPEAARQVVDKLRSIGWAG